MQCHDRHPHLLSMWPESLASEDAANPLLRQGTHCHARSSPNPMPGQLSMSKKPIMTGPPLSPGSQGGFLNGAVCAQIFVHVEASIGPAVGLMEKHQNMRVPVPVGRFFSAVYGAH